MSDTVNYTQYDSFDNQTIVVTNNDELDAAIDALGNGSGGTILLASSGNPYQIDARGLESSPDSAIHITSEDPEDPARLEEVYISDSGYVTLSHMDVHSGAYGENKPEYLQKDIILQDCNNVEMVDLNMWGTGQGTLGLDDDAVEGVEGVSIVNSTDITFSHNSVSGYEHGVGVTGVDGFTMEGNDIFEIQGDGLRGGGLSNAEITDNHFHDFNAATHDVNHSDMIQLWGIYPEGSVNENIVISNNILDAGNGSATQGILIQNLGFYDPDSDSYQLRNSNIEITDNVIHNGQHNGISIAQVDNATVSNNTVLWNENAVVYPDANSEPTSTEPQIRIREATNSTAENNVASSVAINNVEQDANNYILNYDDPKSPNYAYDNVVSLSDTDDQGIEELQFTPDSNIPDGYGASLSTFEPSDEPVNTIASFSSVDGNAMAMEFSAEYSSFDGQLFDPNVHTATWTFSDGTVLEGIDVVHTFSDPGDHSVTLEISDGNGVSESKTYGFEIADSTLFETDFSHLGADDSFWGGTVDIDDDNGAAWTSGVSGDGFELTGASSYVIERENEHINGPKDTLHVELDFRPDEVVDGRLLTQSNGYRLHVTEEGAVSLNFTTSDGTYQIESAPGVITEDNWHTISFSFDGPAETLELSVDGDVVAQTQATGYFDASGYDVTLGSFFGQSTEGTVDNLSISTPASEALSTSPQAPAAANEPDPAPPVAEPAETPDASTAPQSPVEDPAEHPVEDDPVEVEEPEEEQDTPEPPPAEPQASAAVEEQPVEEDEPDEVAPAVVEEPIDDAPAPAAQDEAQGPTKATTGYEDSTDNFISQLFNMIAQLFGLGSDEEETETSADSSPPSEENDVLLSDIVPNTGAVDETMPEDAEDDDDVTENDWLI